MRLRDSRWLPPPVHPQAEFRKRKRARHEAGHIVVTDDLGWTVQLADLQHYETDWAGLSQQLAQTDWNDANQREAIKPLVLKYVTVLVAGHLAENEFDPAEPLVSKRLQDAPWVLETGPAGNADRDRVARYLKLIRSNTMAAVLEAEARAGEILGRREATAWPSSNTSSTTGTSEARP